MADTPEEINVDELLSEVNAPSPERAMTGGEEPAATEKAPEAPTWNGQEWEFEWNGKKVAPDSQEKARTWMSQGYNYSQRMGELNKTWAQKQTEIQQAMQKAQELEKRFSPYSKVDEYARQNPQWWQHVLSTYEQQAKSQPGVDPNIQQVLKPIQEDLGQFKEFFQSYQAEQQRQFEIREDQALDTEIESIRKSYPNIDLKAPDPQSGEPLELRILKHAKEIGTNSFKAAFRDYLHDALIEQAKASGREKVAKDAQANAKKGILGKTPAPVKGLQPAANVRGKSYDQLYSEALAELGIT